MAIEKDEIIAAMSKIQPTTDETGIISAFGIHVQQLPVNFWNNFTWQWTNNVPAELADGMEKALIKATHEYCYHTGYHLIVSKEWREIIAPMVKKYPEDVILCAFALLATWGWGKLEVVELIPFSQMIVRATDYYESEIVQLGKVQRPSAYIIRGLCAAFMDLAYPSTSYPSALGTYQCQQTKGVEVGDAYGEFVVTKVA